MSKYKLTEAQEKMLKLSPVTWEDVRKLKLERVYIRAHKDSATYGPYRVKSAVDCMVSKLDGSDPRYYRRDKGLLAVISSPWPEFVPERKGFKGNSLNESVLDSMVAEVIEAIIEKEKELKTLKLRRDVLTSILRQG